MFWFQWFAGKLFLLLDRLLKNMGNIFMPSTLPDCIFFPQRTMSTKIISPLEVPYEVLSKQCEVLFYGAMGTLCVFHKRLA